jgi:hypothetical protein
MAARHLVHTVQGPFKNPGEAASAFTSWIAPGPASFKTVLDLVPVFRTSRRRPELQALRVLYVQLTANDASWASFRLDSLSATAASSFEAVFAAWVTANPTRIVRKLVRSLPWGDWAADRDEVLLLSSTPGLDILNTYVVRPTNNIAAAAVGDCTFYDPAGALRSDWEARNVGSGLWTAGQRSLASFNFATEEWEAIPPT